MKAHNSVCYFVVFTGFIAAAYAPPVPKDNNQENLILGLIYAFFCLKLLFKYIPTAIITKPWNRSVWVVSALIMGLPKHIRTMGHGCFVVDVVVTTVFSLPKKPESTSLQRLVALFDLFVFFVALYITSANRKRINWKTILSGILFQSLLALFVFRSSASRDISNGPPHLSNVISVRLTMVRNSSLVLLSQNLVSLLSLYSLHSSSLLRVYKSFTFTVLYNGYFKSVLYSL